MESAASLFVIAAPSGAGKTTLVKALVERNPALKFSISFTTRKQRIHRGAWSRLFLRDDRRIRQPSGKTASCWNLRWSSTIPTAPVARRLRNILPTAITLFWKSTGRVRDRCGNRCPGASRSLSCRRHVLNSSDGFAAAAPIPMKSSRGGFGTRSATCRTGMNSTTSLLTTISITRSPNLRQ